VPHSVNWIAGWLLILAGFISGTGLGLYFHREDFWGGYASFRRRIVRLGHIALVALGMLNLLYGLSPWPAAGQWEADVAGLALIIGGAAMPLVCFLTGWREGFRRLFFIPVAALITAAIFTLKGSLP
jgi:hypothetical protein